MLVFVGRLTTIPKQEGDSKIILSTDRTNNVLTVKTLQNECRGNAAYKKDTGTLI